MRQKFKFESLRESPFGDGNLLRIHTPDGSAAIEVTRSNGRARFIESNSLPLQNMADEIPPEELEFTLIESK